MCFENRETDRVLVTATTTAAATTAGEDRNADWIERNHLVFKTEAETETQERETKRSATDNNSGNNRRRRWIGWYEVS
jgi:hypothetical protein